MVDAKLHMRTPLTRELPVYLCARSDEGGEHTNLYVRGLDAFHRRADFMRARAEQRLTIPYTVGGLRIMIGV